jgi:hypothetical protein
MLVNIIWKKYEKGKRDEKIFKKVERRQIHRKHKLK